MSRLQDRLPLAAFLLFFLALIAPAPLAGAQGELQLVIISPSDGEILYASHLGYIVAIPVTGRVAVTHASLENVVVNLAIRSPHAAPLELTTRPDDTGFFLFNLDLNPDNIPLPSVGERYFDYAVHCPDCHFSSAAALPLGQLQLEITAVHPLAGQTTTVRHVTVDRSQRATLPIQVVVDGADDFTVEQIPVQAETRLYEWRGRVFRELTDASGHVELDVEALSQRDTRYLVSVPPTMIDNRRYYSTAAQEVIIAPRTERLDPLTVRVLVENGIINGRIESTVSPAVTDAIVLAVAQPGGLVYAQPLEEDQTFSFDGLPLAQYLVTVHAEDTGSGFISKTAYLDLTEETTAGVSLALVAKPVAERYGRLLDESGSPIPFGWIAGPDRRYVSRVSPLDGSFALADPDAASPPLQVVAPGYWSESVWPDAGGVQEIVMQPRSDRQVMNWGDGQVILPAETVLVEEEDSLSLVRGWIWGHNNRADPFAVNLEGAELEILAGDFALEYAPGEVSWLYVNDGRATFTKRDGSSVQIAGGQMMAFGDGVPTPDPVAADQRVVSLLRATRVPTVDLGYQPAPTLRQRLAQVVSEFGRSLSQVVVAATYLLIVLAPVLALLYGIRRLLKVKN